MPTLVLNKPFNTLCQFTREPGSAKGTLADYVDVPGVYAAGRLDADSEGLVLLTDDGPLQARVAQAGSRRSGKLWKTYWAQVEGQPDAAAVRALAAGVQLKDGPTQPAKAAVISEPADLWPRQPPIRQRAQIPTTWLEIQLAEGRNRQVRRMTAAVGHPTLRLIRAAIGPIGLAHHDQVMPPGAWRQLGEEELNTLWRSRR